MLFDLTNDFPRVYRKSFENGNKTRSGKKLSALIIEVYNVLVSRLVLTIYPSMFST